MSGLEIRCKGEQVFSYPLADALTIGDNSIGDGSLRILLGKFRNPLDIQRDSEQKRIEKRLQEMEKAGLDK